MTSLNLRIRSVRGSRLFQILRSCLRGGRFVVCAGLLALATPNAFGGPNGFDLSNAAIPVDEIRSGGPPRDGIPSIDRPHFIQPGRADFLKDDDIVVSFSNGGTTRAYPLRILVWHEIVNDEIDGLPIAVTYCPLCGTAMVFSREVAGRTVTFGVSGLLYQSDVLLYDRQTESLWSQLKMESVSGRLVETPLEWLASGHMTWAAWKEAHPDGEVLSTRTGHERNYSSQPYRGYEGTEGTMFPVHHTRTELPNKEWVVGIVVGGLARAYPVKQLSAVREIEDVAGGSTLNISYDPAKRQPLVVSADDGEAVPSVMVYWFAWQAFYPETSIWTP